LPRRAAIQRIATSPILLEGGFDDDGNFVYLPFSGLEKMTEYFRRTVLEFFTDKKLLTEQFAQNLLSWNYSAENSLIYDPAKQSASDYPG
jgi:hypothetical protein